MPFVLSLEIVVIVEIMEFLALILYKQLFRINEHGPSVQRSSVKRLFFNDFFHLTSYPKPHFDRPMGAGDFILMKRPFFLLILENRGVASYLSDSRDHEIGTKSERTTDSKGLFELFFLTSRTPLLFISLASFYFFDHLFLIMNEINRLLDPL